MSKIFLPESQREKYAAGNVVTVLIENDTRISRLKRITRFSAKVKTFQSNMYLDVHDNQDFTIPFNRIFIVL